MAIIHVHHALVRSGQPFFVATIRLLCQGLDQPQGRYYCLIRNHTFFSTIGANLKAGTTSLCATIHFALLRPRQSSREVLLHYLQISKLGIRNLSPYLRNSAILRTTKTIAELRTKKSCGTVIADLENLTSAIPQLSAASCQSATFLSLFLSSGWF